MKIKRKRNKKNIMPVLIILFILFLLSILMLVIRITIKNNIYYENIHKTQNLTDSEIASANTILINNIIIGAEYNNKWGSVANISDTLQTKKDLDITMYSQNAKLGTYKTASIRYNANSNMLYTTTTRVPSPDKYIAVTKDFATRTSFMKETVSTDKDLKAARRALGRYLLLNSTVQITKVYDVYVNQNIAGKIICAVSKKNKYFGVYSALIYVEGNKSQIIKYAYVKDIKKAERWPIYSLEFVTDIDADSISEVVLQETYSKSIAYSIMKYTNGKFYQVLKTTINI